ncbi:RNA-directed DNA polymerase from mobile element jockey-like [Brachionus plicatilis]|uniref:RNA-directed DNA polymerase from mobile element jockey-like n=1 Tax=Brachionus plicatilis TaxID=10195 RepID=A0A3M7Q737_BRAPC|nr:RNA-directed DNA polymerase from mobile element jockey-like [Brachionus plicatilis]
MEDYIPQANWPVCPPATASVTKTSYIWLQQISTAMSNIQTRVRLLEDENKSQAIELSNLRTELNELKNISPNSNIRKFVTKQRQKKRSRYENNLIISGLVESTDVNEEEKVKEDQAKVEVKLETLGVNKTNCKRIAILKSKRLTQVKVDEQSTNTRPALLIVELKDNGSKQTEEFRNVYINQDRTLSERAHERYLRETKKERNSQLTHLETVDGITLIYKMENAVKRALDSKKCNGILVTGDFNFPYIKYHTDGYVAVYGPNDSPGNLFIDMLNNESLSQTVHFPTFRKADGSMTNTLDYVITESPDRVSLLKETPPLAAWMTHELLNLIKIKKTLWHQLQSTWGKNREIEAKYKKVKREIEKKSRYSIKAFEIDLASDKNNPKHLFAYINSKQTIKKRIS